MQVYTKEAILTVFYFQIDRLILSFIFVRTVQLPAATYNRGERERRGRQAHYGQCLFPL